MGELYCKGRMGRLLEALRCHRKLSSKVFKRAERMRVVEAALILAVAAFHLAIVAWSVRADEFQLGFRVLIRV